MNLAPLFGRESEPITTQLCDASLLEAIALGGFSSGLPTKSKVRDEIIELFRRAAFALYRQIAATRPRATVPASGRPERALDDEGKAWLALSHGALGRTLAGEA